MPNNGLKIERAAIESLVPYGKNPRIGNLDAISESLAQHGQYRPLVVRAETREILGGNHTWKAAKSLGWSEVDVTLIDVDSDQAKRIVLVDNATSDRAGYDHHQLFDLLDSLDGLDGTGYGEDDLRAVISELDDEPSAGKTDPDDAPEVPKEPKTKAGDIWELGDHRLVCGDSTCPEVLERLLDGATVEAVWTDPPYNVDYVGKTSEELKIENDKLLDTDFAELLVGALGQAFAAAAPGAPIYMCHADSARLVFEAAFTEAGWLQKQTLIWVKNSLVLGRQDYQWKHEPILYGWKPGAAHRWYGEFDKTTVVEVNRPARSEFHPTMKPVELIVGCLQNSTQRGDKVLDVFGGSGSTLMAAEQMSRSAYLVELDPRYCDVIVRRWEDFTGRKATRGKTNKAHA